MVLNYGNFEKVFKDIWDKQCPLHHVYVTREELDFHLKELSVPVKAWMENQGVLGLHLFKNVFVVNDITMGEICDSCKGSFVVIHFDKPITSVSDNVVWLPSLESFACKNFIVDRDQVVPINSDALKNKEISYKCLTCEESTWKYMSYNSVFGLTYSDEEVKCFSNAGHVENVAYNLMTPEILESDYPEGSHVILSDVRENIENMNMDYIFSWVDSLTKVEKSKTFSIILHINGYDSDPRDLWEIPEVRRYAKRLIEEKPEILWFLDQKEVLIFCYVSRDSSQMAGGVSRVAIIGEKVFELSERVLKALKENEFFNESDIRSYMKEFNAVFGREIYNI